MKVGKKTWSLLIIALVLILVGSLLACLFNSGTGSVKVTRISFDAPNGTLSGLLYMPKGASASDPRPTVIVTHGYLNSAEMQDANAIELSRRGFVVLALDQYDHGHSDLKNEVYEPFAAYGAFLQMWAPFWLNSMHDAVAYMYAQDYVLKDAAGNGIIGVTGHSMGGFGTTMAVALDEQEFLAGSGVRKIYCALTEGSDFSYTAIFGINVATADALGGGRIQGKVAAQYDEFFFNDPAVEGGTVRKKDYVSTPDGLAFLQQTSGAKANTWYDTSDGGRRIIYQPAQTHPWNHFSATTTAYAVSFYTEAFSAYADKLNAIEPTSQIWQLKELFECVALVGFVMFIIAVANILLKVPFFSKANSGEIPVAPSPKGFKKVLSILITIVAILLPALFFCGLMDGQEIGMKALFYLGIVAGVGGLAAIIFAFFKKDHLLKRILGGCFLLVSGGVLALISKLTMYEAGKTWSALGVNTIAYWTLGCALIALVVLSAVYVLLKDKETTGLGSYGVVFKPLAIIAGICGAIVTFAVSYGLLFLVDLIFKTDFRIWTFAFKTFDANIIPVILRYLPTFLLFYLVSTASITINTNTEKTKGFKGYLLAIALNAGGPILWLAHQYIRLFATGVSAHPDSALSGIVLVAMVPTLSIAAIISRNLYKRTGNIWMAGCLNAMLMTTMTIANTMVAFK